MIPDFDTGPDPRTAPAPEDVDDADDEGVSAPESADQPAEGPDDDRAEGSPQG